MAKSCCETGTPEPVAKWRVWTKRAFYLLLAVLFLFVIWNQLTN